MHVGTYRPYVAYNKILRENQCFLPHTEKDVYQHTKNPKTELMQLPRMRMKIFLSFKVVHSIKKNQLHKPLFQVEPESSALAPSAQMM